MGQSYSGDQLAVRVFVLSMIFVGLFVGVVVLFIL